MKNNMVAPFTRLFAGENKESFATEPIRGELYSVERLEEYAPVWAESHGISRKASRNRLLLRRLEENSRELNAAYRVLADAVHRESTITPAAEWLVDNFHIIEEQLREIKEDLPRKFYYELPKLKTGEMSGLPRIYALAVTLIAHTDSRLDSDTMLRFFGAYQQTAPLTIGELWAVPISLRLCLVENLRRLATRIVEAREERDLADSWADKLLAVSVQNPEAVEPMLKEIRGPLGRAFFVQLARRLRDQGPEIFPANQWLDINIATEGMTIEQAVQLEHQRQAASQVTVGNIITSMRLISTLDWREFVESLSLVDKFLSQDPAGVYSQMDFSGHDRYRHQIERISKRTGVSEIEIARAVSKRQPPEVNQNSGAVSQTPFASPESHVGYYLIGAGRPEFEAEFGYCQTLHERIKRAVTRHPTRFYLGTLSFLTGLIIFFLAFYADVAGAGYLALFGLVFLVIVPASEAALSVLNWDITQLFTPRVLPKLDFSGGIPAEARTMVVIPTLFTSKEEVGELVEHLEIHYLANPDENLFFALLGDFSDSDSAETPADEALLEYAQDGIAQLNERHGKPGRFHLFHRRRLWNASAGRWMGCRRIDLSQTRRFTAKTRSRPRSATSPRPAQSQITLTNTSAPMHRQHYWSAFFAIGNEL